MIDLATPTTVPKPILAAWADLAGGEVRPIGTGLINETFLVVGGGRPTVVQRLHPSFDANVSVDLDVITALLARKGIVTPRLKATDDGRLCVVDDSGHRWRAQTYIAGQSFDRLRDLNHAKAAGELVARFHLALDGEEIEYKKASRQAHDTPSHLRFLSTTLASHRDHVRFSEVEPLAESIFAATDSLPNFQALPLRHCHGDLKCSNLLFDEKGRGLCLVDLDTLAPMRWPHEMGDAFRSWCNRAGEDAEAIHFDLAIFKAALDGYASVAHSFVNDDEQRLLVEGIRIICLELSARFLADVLNASYFGWDPDRFPTRSDHNLIRARGQLNLALDLERQQTAAERVVYDAFKVPSSAMKRAPSSNQE